MSMGVIVVVMIVVAMLVVVMVIADGAVVMITVIMVIVITRGCIVRMIMVHAPCHVIVAPRMGMSPHRRRLRDRTAPRSR